MDFPKPMSVFNIPVRAITYPFNESSSLPDYLEIIYQDG